jgi:hypothetical protein
MKKITAFLMSSVALAASIGTTPAVTKHSALSSFERGHYAHRFVRKSKLSTLYDQTGNDAGVATVSQNFESSFDQYDSQGADDFVVPAGVNWRVHEVDAVGVYFNGFGPAVSENVFFYKDRKSLPGKMVHQYLNLTGIDDGTGSFAITLPPTYGVQFKPGHYWVSVQINMDSAVGGEWGWENQTTQEGAAAAWQNPGNGFNTGCTTWGVENQCVTYGAGQRTVVGGVGDQIFALKGKTKGG